MFNKLNLIKEIKKNLKNIEYFDIFSVVNVLIDELKKEIKNKKYINLPNFGKIRLKIFEPKKIKNVRDGKEKITKSYNILRVIISKNIIQFLKETEQSEKNAIK